MNKKRYLISVFDNEDKLIHSAQDLLSKNFNIHDIYTPFPLHGLDDLLKIKTTRLPYICFGAGFIGCSLGLIMQYYISAVEWPLNVGGKPFFSWPAFIPITFELTILIAALTTIVAFFYRSNLFPGKMVKIFDKNQTNDRFLLAIEDTDSSLKEILVGHGCMEVQVKEL